MIFLGCLFDRKNESIYLSKSKTGLSNAANTYQWNLIDGLNANLAKPISIINALPVGIWKRQYKDFILESRIWEYNGSVNHELGCINLPFIKQYQRYRKCLRLLRRSDDRSVLIYSAYLPFLKAVRKLDKKYNVTLIVTDLPEYYDLGKTSALTKIFRKLNNRAIYKCMERVDNFVLLTEQMEAPLRVGNRPYTIIEGICNPDSLISSAMTDQNEKIILYTGTLHRKYGIGNLLDAFEMISDPDYKLWICGGGDMKAQIQEMAQRDSRIQFFGYLPKSEIAELQKKATVLVNPRQNNEEYTKYSFPSKTMEYMMSGKPVIMYKLDGIPDEYDKYLSYVPDNSVAALRDTLVGICELSPEERASVGRTAQQFIANSKSAEKQAKKLLDMIQPTSHINEV